MLTYEQDLVLRYDALLQASKALAAKLREIEGNSQYKSVWILSMNRGYKYTGPNWSNALNAVEELIKEDGHDLSPVSGSPEPNSDTTSHS